MSDDENDETADSTQSGGDDVVEPTSNAPDLRGGVCRPGYRTNVDRTGVGEDEDAETSPPVREETSDTGVLARLEEIQNQGAAESPSPARQAERAMEAFEPEERLETKLRWEGPGKLVYEPTLYQVGSDQYAIEAKRETRGIIPWGFWGGLLFVGVAIIVIAGAQDIYTSWDILWAMIGLTVGALMYRFGRKSSLDEMLLSEIDGRRRTLHWPDQAQSGLEENLLSFDDVTEVVFGMTKLPVDENVADVRVDAFALLVRTTQDELIPVVEGSPYKGEVHEIAKFIADETETVLTYVGRGID
ncbi:MAG: hypothetical protein ABEN55_09725 [Bradymonadaceae bacterium]